MAGGLGRGRAHPVPPLPEPRPDPPTGKRTAPRQAPRRHCWVTAVDPPSGPHAGLILEWSRRPDGWWALVSYVIESDAVLVQQWLHVDLLRPVDP